MSRACRPAAVPAAVPAALSTVLLGLSGAARAQTAPVLPGYWESTETFSMLLSGGSHTRKCLTAGEIARFVAAPGNSHYRCTYASRQVSDGQAPYRGGACYSRRGKKALSDVSVDGRYQPDAFHLQFHFTLVVTPTGLGLPGSAVIDARRISAECPADLVPDK